MGPALLKNVVDGLKWAQCYSLVKLPMVEWASTVPEKCCRWSQIGPTLLVGGDASGLEWAQRCP